MALTPRRKTIESYYQTGSDWHKENIINLVAELKEEGNFEDLHQPIRLYQLGIDSFLKYPDSPTKVMVILEKQINKFAFDEKQAVFILDQIATYLNDTSWEEVEEVAIENERKEIFLKVFEADINRRKKDLKQAQPKPLAVSDLRTSLKGIFHTELEKLPDYFEELTPKEKLHFLCKLMPYVMPKVEAVSHDHGESSIGWSW